MGPGTCAGTGKDYGVIMSVIISLFDTDPLATFALGGLGVTLIVTIALFGFVITRHDRRA